LFDGKSGEILGLAGFGLLLLHRLMRSQARKSPKPPRGLYLVWLQWGDVAAFLTILAGLTLMWAHR
jgi:hypothetical protein